MAGRRREALSSFEEAYAGQPPWDIGRPQPEFVAAEERGEIRGRCLDVGCGTGEHALYLASRGHPAVGVDSAPTAIKLAKEKAAARKLDAVFRVHNALRLPELGLRFDAVVDSGLFHVFDDWERGRFVTALRAVLAPGGTYHVLCFSDKEPPGWGPRRVAKAELESAFKEGFAAAYIRDAQFATREGPEGARAFFARFNAV